MRLNRSFLSTLLLLVTLSAACASTRSVSVGSEAATYSIEVLNSTGRSADVYWSTGGNPKLLGSVAPGRRERFIIAGATSSNVSVTATDTSGRTLGPYAVELQAGVTKSLTLR
jgi:hypothetical protein